MPNQDYNQSARIKILEERYLKARRLVRALKIRYWNGLIADRNVIGAAFGRRTAQNITSDEPALVIYVMRKVPARFVPPSKLLPRRLYAGGESVEVDVVETGPLHPLTFDARERPATAGISIGNANEVSAGTLGAVVIDNTDGAECILSNNHVMARENAATLGEMILQQGAFDGGMSPADDIATLRRFVMINATGNTVDGAIAATIKGAVIDQVHNNLIPTATANHPAVGLLFAGGCNRTIMNPIADVLSQLNIGFPGGAGATVSPDIGMNVEKVGRTTEYTASTIKEIDATVTLGYNFGNATFDHQITTGWMSDPGDSGSLICQGGAGGDEDHCGCGTTQAAESLLGTSVNEELTLAATVRDKFLRQTRLGRYAVDLFLVNEDRALDRFRETRIEPDDRAYAQRLFAKYREDVRAALFDGEKSQQRLTEQHFRDARSALKRGQKYLKREEIEASEKLYALAKEHGTGKNAREILALLDNEDLFKEVRDIVDKIGFLRSPDCR